VTATEGQTIFVAGESLVASASRSLFWPRESTLFVADLHLGKAASFRSANLPIPEGTTLATLQRLTESLRTTGASRLVLLGDLWHDRQGRTQEIEDKLCRWRDQWPELEIFLVTGNHDRRSGRPTEICGIVESETLFLSPFLCRHHPEPSREGYVLAGHLHPAARLEGRGSETLTLPCFWFTPDVGVLPAFGEFTGVAVIRPSEADQVLVVAQGAVFNVYPSP
jgi:DNA ligase-associated metallophosphoesterase